MWGSSWIFLLKIFQAQEELRQGLYILYMVLPNENYSSDQKDNRLVWILAVTGSTQVDYGLFGSVGFRTSLLVAFHYLYGRA